MPITVTFDLEFSEKVNAAKNKDSIKSSTSNRITCAFNQFGWESLGGTAYRYPKLHSEHKVEDWFNHVVPALMLLRTLALEEDVSVSRFSIDAHSSTGHSLGDEVNDVLPKKSKDVTFYESKDDSFNQGKLKEWIDSVKWPYPPIIKPKDA